MSKRILVAAGSSLAHIARVNLHRVPEGVAPEVAAAIEPLASPAMIAIPARFNVATTQLFQFFGNPVRVEREPGLKFKVPFIQNVEYYDRRILDLDPPVQEVLLADQKRINVDSFARYRIVDPRQFILSASFDL